MVTTGQVTIVDSNNNVVGFPTSSPVIDSSPNGVPLDSPFVTGSGTNTNDVIVTLDVTYAKSLSWYWSAVGTSYSVVLELTWDGTTWIQAPCIRIDRPSVWIANVTAPSSGAYLANTNSAIGARLKIFNAGTGGPVTAGMRTLRAEIPTFFARPRTTSHIITPSTAIGTGVVITTNRGYFLGCQLHNLVASDRYISISDSTTYSSASEIARYRIKAGLDFQIPDREIGTPVGSGISYKVFTDNANTTPASTGDLMGSISWSA